MTQDEIIEMAIQGHASTRDAICWAMNQEREACAKETKEIKDLLTLIAGIVRDTHLHGSEMQRLLDKEKAIRARNKHD